MKFQLLCSRLRSKCRMQQKCNDALILPDRQFGIAKPVKSSEETAHFLSFPEACKGPSCSLASLCPPVGSAGSSRGRSVLLRDPSFFFKSLNVIDDFRDGVRMTVDALVPQVFIIQLRPSGYKRPANSLVARFHARLRHTYCLSWVRTPSPCLSVQPKGLGVFEAV